MPLKFKVGDRFTVDPATFPPMTHGVVYVVESVPRGRAGVNYVGRPESGSGRGVRAPEHAMTAYVEGETPTPPSLTFTAPPCVGTLVKVKADAPTRNIPKEALFVVLGEARNHPDAVRLVKLGGDEGRYFTRVPVAWVDVVDVDHALLGQ